MTQYYNMGSFPIIQPRGFRAAKNFNFLPARSIMALEYIREYRTYFHISKSYGVSESAAYKTVRWVEDTLIKHPDFALPGRKALLKSDMEYEIVLVDASENSNRKTKKKGAK